MTEKDQDNGLPKIGQQGFAHRRRSLAAGESVPAAFSLAEQILALSGQKLSRIPASSEGNSVLDRGAGAPTGDTGGIDDEADDAE